jgi:hypothetical protein
VVTQDAEQRRRRAVEAGASMRRLLGLQVPTPLGGQRLLPLRETAAAHSRETAAALTRQVEGLDELIGEGEQTMAPLPVPPQLQLSIESSYEDDPVRESAGIGYLWCWHWLSLRGRRPPRPLMMTFPAPSQRLLCLMAVEN